MVENPFESPRTDAEKVAKKRRAVPWGKGVGMGIATWATTLAGVAICYAFDMAAISPIHWSIHLVLSTLSAPLLMLFFALTNWGEGVQESPFTIAVAVLAIASGPILHTASWTLVFTIWRRRSTQREAD